MYTFEEPGHKTRIPRFGYKVKIISRIFAHSLQSNASFYMFRRINILVLIITMAGMVLLSSCSDPKPDKGSLGITVVNGITGMPVPYELLYISKSYQDLENNIHLDSSWTDANGSLRFHQLAPGIYWYDTQHWQDFGAARVMNGIDTDVTLWVNTPDTTVQNK